MPQITTVRIRPNADKSFPATSAITAGQIVETVIVSTVDVAQPATAGSVKVVGVALTSATPTDTSAGTAVNAFPLPTHVTVGHGECYVTYAAQCNVGLRLKAAAAGQVTPWVSGTDAANLIIGYCTATTASGAIGAAYIGH